MQLDAIESAPGQHTLAYVMAGREAARPKGDPGSDLPATQTVQEADKTDRVEISDVSRTLAALEDQRDDGPELQLPPDKLQKLASS